jgi:ketosteroid isomerase-like protein
VPLPEAKDSDGTLRSARGARLTSSEPQSTEELVELIRQGVTFSGGTVLDGPEGIDQMAEILRGRVHPDFVTVMVSESAGPQEWPGLDGFKEALSDWISPYEAFRLEIDEVVVEDDKIVFLARQIATTKHGGVEVETESTSVWWVEGGLITEVGFYLDRLAGLKAAGLDPHRRPRGSRASEARGLRRGESGPR